MGKRSKFERNPRDLYDTPYKAVLPLLPFLKENTEYAEPCYGRGHLVNHLAKHGHYAYHESDIHPMVDGIMVEDALTRESVYQGCECVITNPPWDRKILHPMINKFINNSYETWLLFDSDWWYTKQAIPFKPHCHKRVSVGRVKWIAGSKSTGKDNCEWYLFKKETTKYAESY